MKTFYKITIYFVLFVFSIIQKVNAQTATFSQTYTGSAASTAQCAAWTTFMTTLSSSGNYIKMTISGTYDPTGISCTDKTIITAFVAAIKNGTTYISGTTSGHVWSICNRYSGEIWIDPPASCSGSNCPSPGYIIRPCIGGTNVNWGGVNTATCGAPTQVMTLKFEMPTKPNDAGISAINTPLCAPNIVVTYNNNGTNTLDSAKINWSVNGTLQTQNKYTTPIVQGGKAVNITLTPTYNFIDGNTYTVKAWTSLPNNKTDSVPANDTSVISFKYLGPALDPTVSDVIKCGPGQATLIATPGNVADSLVWYDAATAGNVIARGKNTLSPPLVIGTNTFYVQASKIGASTTLANAMTPSTGFGSTYSGGFANLTPNKGILIDSFDVQMTGNVPGATWSVWMRTGTYVGYETSSTGWTKVVDNKAANVRLVGSYYRSYIKIPQISLNSGTTYGFYIVSTPTVKCSPWCNASVTGGRTTSGPDLVMFQDRVAVGATEFTGIQMNYPMTWETYYRPSNCPSNRVPLKVTVKPSPYGATFIKSTPFQSTMPNTNGTVGSPDIVAKGDQLTYEITPPTGYFNTDYGVTWIMTGFTFKTKSGRVLPTTYYSPSTPTPSGSTNAKVTFTADAAIVDSTIIMTVGIFDLGPWYCDSLLTRYIRIAPRPVADFLFLQPVCDGDNVIFTNKTTYSSGNITNKWDFNTGNPADTSTASDVVFKFPTYGTYNVSLTSTSVPYGYKDTKTYTVVVSEIPKIGFKVFNACLGDSVKFINSTTIGSGTIDYKWDLGNGTYSTKVNPRMKYAIAGGYKVTLTATSNGCKSVMTKNAQQFARPVAKYSVPSVLCDKSEIQFTNGSTIPLGNMGYVWYFGDGIISGETNPTHSFSAIGTKTVKLRAMSEFGCADSITKTLSLTESPLADFSTGALCNLKPTQFNFIGTKPSGGLTSFNWDFAGEGTTTVENPTKLFSTIGKKIITLTLTTNNGCSDVISKEIDIKLQSKADFKASDVCDGNDAVFTNISTVSAGNLLYNWKFGDGGTSIAQSPRHLFPTGISQTYNVTLVAIVPGGCSDSINKPVSVNATPISNYSYTTSGHLVYFKPTQAGNTTYHWDFGDGGTSENFNTQYHYLNDFGYGKYNACLTTINAAGCLSQTCKSIVITGGIDKLNKLNGVAIYPNPNDGNFTITVENPKADITIGVYNLLGELVKTIDANPLKSVYIVDVNVSNGIYLIKVTNGGLTSTQKVTINK